MPLAPASPTLRTAGRRLARQARAVLLAGAAALCAAGVLGAATRQDAGLTRLRVPAPSSGAKDLALSVEHGAVTLTGTVPDLELRRRIVEAAMAVPNVTDVVDHLRVSPVKRPDAQIRRDVLEALEADPVVGQDSVRVQVADGAVTLQGTLKEWQERDLAGWITSKVPGVREVVNTIVLTPMVRPDDVLQQEIRDDLVIELPGANDQLPVSTVPASTPAVEVSGGVATLTGTVSTLLIRRTAGQIAASAVGVTAVKNQLRVSTDPRATDAETARAVRQALEKLTAPEAVNQL